MKLGIMEKITIAITLVLVVWAGIESTKAFDKHYNPEKYNPYILPTAEEKPLPKNIKQLSEKYEAYQDLYNSDKPIFVYGYTRYTPKKRESIKFHKSLKARLEKEKLGYKVITYRNWRDYDNTVEENNMDLYEGDGSTCTMANPSSEELDSLRNTSKDCLEFACIIDMKKNKYVILSRNVDFIIDELKKYNKK